MSDSMVFWLSFYVLFFVFTAYIGYRTNNLVAGVLLGYVLGPIGLVLLLLSQDRKYGRCPYCSAKVHHQAYFCHQCEKKCYKKLRSRGGVYE